MIVSKVFKCGCVVSRVYSDKVNMFSICYKHSKKFEKEGWYNDFIECLMKELLYCDNLKEGK